MLPSVSPPAISLSPQDLTWAFLPESIAESFLSISKPRLALKLQTSPVMVFLLFRLTHST